jgi:hypothetical protein
MSCKEREFFRVAFEQSALIADFAYRRRADGR